MARSDGSAKGAFYLGALLIVAAALIDDGTMAWLLAPVIMIALGYAAARVPLRNSLMVLAYCSLTLDYPNEHLAFGLFRTPFFAVGWAMLGHLNNLTGVGPLAFSGTDVVLGFLTIIALMRERSNSKIDRTDRIPTPRPLLRLAMLSVGGIVWVWLFGMVRGGDFRMSLWQVEKVVYVPFLFFLYHLALRGPKDLGLLAKVVLVAAFVRASLAIFIINTVPPPIDPTTGEPLLPYATSHSDSMLFATGLVLVIMLLLERAAPTFNRKLLLLLPILIMGMVANNRRLVWVHVGMILMTLYSITPDNPIKRRIRRSLYGLAPLIAVYVAAGWNSTSPAFKPARIMRSVVEPSTDGSSLWRELENYDLIVTLRESMLLGQGYGHRFIEAIPLPAVAYDLEYFLPHNSLLGLLAFAGLVGFTAITLLWGGGVYFAMRAYHAAKQPSERVAAIICVGAVIVYMVQCFGDLGLGSWTGVHILAPSLALAGKLAVSTGAWSDTRPTRAG